MRRGTLSLALPLAVTAVAARVDAQTFQFEFGAGGGAPGAAPGQFATPFDVTTTTTTAGRIVVADTHNHRIQIFDANGQFIRHIGAGLAGNSQGSAALC